MFSSNTSQVSSGGYEIQRSLRFNSADSAYLNRTPASAGSRTTWTWSGWVKRSTFTTSQYFLTCWNNGSNDTDFFGLRFVDTTDRLEIRGFSTAYLITTQVFRDPSAWYHIVVAINTTQATADNRVTLYVNGAQVTAFDTRNNPAQNATLGFNQAAASSIGATLTPNQALGGYMTEVNFIDGQALTPSSFGAFDAQTGVWGPTRYAGSYGTNGFYLNFSDNSNTTAATLGRDYSGNSNNWTPNNFSVSAGAGNDSLVDVPTNWGTDTGVGGSVRGNYATWNPLVVNKPNLTNGNLDADGSDLKTSISTIGVSTGKWYWEILIRSGTDTPNMGVTSFPNDNADPGVYLGVGRSYVSSGGGGGVYKNYTATSTVADSDFSSANTAGATIGFALDCDAGTLSYYVNNVLGYTDSTIATGTLLYPMTCNFNSGSSAYRNTSVNFGQRPFAYTAPSGFRALNTQNLPTPTIGATTATQANKYFDVVLRNGGAPSGGTYSTTVNMANGALLWDKPRNSVSSNYLVDSVRGISKNLRSNTTDAESTDVSWFTGFNNGSFTTGSSDWGSSTTVVDWIWAANGTGVTNTAGTVNSTVSANTTSGFSVVTYGGNGANSTIGHGLGAAPRMVIVKRRGAADAWIVYHASVGNTGLLVLNTTAAASTSSAYWNNTSPTSSVFTVGTAGEVNTNGSTFVAYCFAEVPGYSRFGSYTGNGSSTDGPFVFCGFRPRYVLIKRTDVVEGWYLYDTARNTFNALDKFLEANSSAAEATFTFGDYLSNGFKIRNNATGMNGNGGTFIFAAFAEFPFKYSLAR